jgi:hypothetical protein
MPKLEVSCRYKRELTEEEKAVVETEKLIQGEHYNPESKFTYAKLTFELLDVKSFNEVDQDHICVTFHGGGVAVIKLCYSKFKNIYCMLTGQLVTTETDFKMPE